MQFVKQDILIASLSYKQNQYSTVAPPLSTTELILQSVYMKIWEEVFQSAEVRWPLLWIDLTFLNSSLTQHKHTHTHHQTVCHTLILRSKGLFSKEKDLYKVTVSRQHVPDYKQCGALTTPKPTVLCEADTAAAFSAVFLTHLNNTVSTAGQNGLVIWWQTVMQLFIQT